MTHSIIRIAPLILPLAIVACSEQSSDETASMAQEPQVTVAQLEEHISILASDEFGGRAPASPGEELTVEYLSTNLQEAGVSPGNGDSYYQQVPVISIAANPDTALHIAGEEGELTLQYGSDVMMETLRYQEMASLEDSEMVFVGYGINAPEYDWNDYAGVDVRGKTVVALVNDPGYITQDETLFNGFEMTYYGRWTYKYEEAARQGAAGIILVHEDGRAGYPWAVVSGSWSGPQFGLVPSEDDVNVEIQGWMTTQSAERVFDLAGLDYQASIEAAHQRGFEAVEMGVNASAMIENTLDTSQSRNVIGVIEGAERPDEYIIYTAHWDHLGTDPTLEGDQIYNGALDNASGTGALLAMAEAFAAGERPDRSIIFLFVTAEEQGLIGSAYYAANPTVPLNHIVAGLNMDGMNVDGPSHDLMITGMGLSDLDAIMEQVASETGRVLVPDSEPEKGYYFRSDHFELAKLGVPMIYPNAGIDLVDGGKEAGMAANEAYLRDRYHKPADEFDETWNLEGAAADANLYMVFGKVLANSDQWPEWNVDSPFRAIRVESMNAD